MDRLDLEPADRLHEDQPRLRACYAERMAMRLQAMGQPNYRRVRPDIARASCGAAADVEEAADDLRQLDERPVPRDVPVEFIQRVFDTMRRASWHQFQVLTKRSERLLELDAVIDWPSERLDGCERVRTG